MLMPTNLNQCSIRTLGRGLMLAVCLIMLVSASSAFSGLESSPRIRFVRQSPLQAQAPESKAAPVELMHDLATPVEKKLIKSTPLTAGKMQIIMMEVTAYCPCKKCCGASASGLTASGRNVRYNGGRFVAADNRFKFGSRLLIPGYSTDKPVEVIDRGGAIKGDKLDVFFPTHQEAITWGRKLIPVTVFN
jgi:3D (Asp-Asp-Asp) domain-containing protein